MKAVMSTSVSDYSALDNSGKTYPDSKNNFNLLNAIKKICHYVFAWLTSSSTHKLLAQTSGSPALEDEFHHQIKSTTFSQPLTSNTKSDKYADHADRSEGGLLHLSGI